MKVGDNFSATVGYVPCCVDVIPVQWAIFTEAYTCACLEQLHWSVKGRPSGIPATKGGQCSVQWRPVLETSGRDCLWWVVCSNAASSISSMQVKPFQATFWVPCRPHFQGTVIQCLTVNLLTGLQWCPCLHLGILHCNVMYLFLADLCNFSAARSTIASGE